MSRTILHAQAFCPKGRGSFERFLLGLARRQAADGWRVHFLFCGEPVDWFAERLKGVAQYHVAPGAPLDDPGYGSLEDLMQRLQPDVLSLAFCSLFSLRALRIARQARTAFLDHSSWDVPVRVGWRKLAAKARGVVAGYCYDRVISCSDLNRQRNVTRSFLPSKKCVRVYNGVPSVGNANPQPPADLPATPGRYFFYAGQLTRFKGVHTLLAAFARVAKKIPDDVRLLLAGAGPDETELRKMAQGFACDERIKFLGHRNDVPALMAYGLATVVPSEWPEAFGLVVAEAMASGTVVIGSNAGAVPEVLGRGGLLFERGSVSALAGVMSQVSRGEVDRESLIKAAQHRAKTHFTMAQMVDGYASEFNALVSETIPLARRAAV